MNLNPIKIGKFSTKNNLFLAPLAGYTNYAFRKIASEAGAGLTYTEMVSAKGLKYGSENTKELLYTKEEENVAAQIFGCEPSIMRAACESEELSKFSVIDINMGCPVPKIYKNGEGSALLENPKTAEKIVEECTKSGKEITVKFRIGVKDNAIIGEEFAKRMEGAGASLITIHGRTREHFYSGDVNYKEIERAKNAVKIPVIANGGIYSLKDGEDMLKQTGADGIMIARATLFDPQIFADFTNNPRRNKYEMIETQIRDMLEFADERFTVVFMRKMVVFYIKGMYGASAYKEKLFSALTINEILSIAKEIFG